MMRSSDYKITNSGCLEIRRSGIYVPQRCPRTLGNDTIMSRICGNWCPLFGEPEVLGITAKLQLCEGVELSGEFTDEREKE